MNKTMKKVISTTKAPSAMITGNPYFKLYPYITEEHVFKILDDILK